MSFLNKDGHATQATAPPCATLAHCWAMRSDVSSVYQNYRVFNPGSGRVDRCRSQTECTPRADIKRCGCPKDGVLDSFPSFLQRDLLWPSFRLDSAVPGIDSGPPGSSCKALLGLPLRPLSGSESRDSRYPYQQLYQFQQALWLTYPDIAKGPPSKRNVVVMLQMPCSKSRAPQLRSGGRHLPQLCALPAGCTSLLR